ncbi:catalase KatB [Pseudomonas fluorescens]|uniref:Catalase n=1 Tax=Pseudomonas fluorescens (strain Pf0-1) TaxID=205922 RepID=Q3K6I1_PSEPF|nr:catalase KatB [Pseudomonas fluorescens]ABA76623.1 catalase [Pseudomonas fluorescens Pf0-1]MBY9026553.1 catalase KatB [Pseudomonas fluorescens]MBY9031528.1 catalase KatB [Pseudomonas fluorescens]MBY9038479.1 catalase KatB [Pseudomonas fluorescens]MBY9044475.1 catalase KatB [Pseudomonas fluorescens]
MNSTLGSGIIPRRTIGVLAASLLTLSVNAAPLTRDNGAAVGDNQNSQTAGANGPVLLQDVQLIQKLQRFDRERIPERVVHARGTGAHGTFTTTNDLSDLSKAKVFTAGQVTPVFVRFSAVVHGNHSPETLRDPRGFATKFYTADGNWDLVGNNFPTFFIRDAIKFPDMVHAFKPDPRTNLDDDSRRFDFFSHVPEATRTLTELYSNSGTPASYREMDGNSVHAYKLVNAKGDVHYVKFHWKSLQGIKNLDPKQVEKVQGRDYSHMTHDLVENIQKGNFPKWDLYIQVLNPQDLSKFEFDPLDATKIWPGVPERKVGQMVLNRNPANVFQETEQVAMAPSNVVPGIEPSEDRLLQGRIFAYADTQMYRLGANALQLPINAAKTAVNNGNQDGAMNAGASTSGVNYEPSRLQPREETAGARYSQTALQGSTQQAKIQREQNFKQAGDLYRSFSKKERQDLIESFGGSLASADDESKHIMLSFLYKADPEYGAGVTKVAKGDLSRVKALAAKLAD